MPLYDAGSIPGDDDQVKLLEIKTDVPQNPYEMSPALISPPEMFGSSSFEVPEVPSIHKPFRGSTSNSPICGSYTVSPMASPRRGRHAQGLIEKDRSSNLATKSFDTNFSKSNDAIRRTPSNRSLPPQFVAPPPPDSTPPPLANDRGWDQASEWTNDSEPKSGPSNNDWPSPKKSKSPSIKQGSRRQSLSNTHSTEAEVHHDQVLTVTMNRAKDEIQIRQDEGPMKVILDKQYKSLG